jgi:hypothetical protein
MTKKTPKFSQDLKKIHRKLKFGYDLTFTFTTPNLKIHMFLMFL